MRKRGYKINVFLSDEEKQMLKDKAANTKEVPPPGKITLNDNENFSYVDCDDPLINSKLNYAVMELKK